MEQVLEREAPQSSYEDIVLYDDYGNRVTNPAMLRSLAEAMEIAADWRRSMTSGVFEDKEYAQG